MMRTMRENTKWIMLATSIAFVGLMVFQWGMDLSGRSGANASGGEIGRINGQPISNEEFNSVYRNLYDQQQKVSDAPIGTALNRQIEDAAWDQVVMQRLIAQELRSRGIIVTDNEIRQAALYEPPAEFRNNASFQTNGQFDLTKYHNYMSSPAVDTELLLQLEAYYRDAIPRSKLYFQETAGVFATDDQLWRIWRDTRDSVSVRYLAFDPHTLVPDASVTVSDADMNAYYRAHESDFLRPARASIRYVMIDREPTAADSATALARAQRVEKELAAGGNFADIAKRESADTVSANDGGKVTVHKGRSAPALDQAAFAQPIGKLGSPVLTQFGYHILRVDSRAADSAVVHQVLIPIELSTEHENRVLDQADSLDALTETMKLDQIARNLGLEVKTADLIPGLDLVPGLGQTADGSDWAFHTGKPGEVSPVFETPTAYYVFELVKRDDERTLTLDEAKQSIHTAVMNEKKLVKARDIAREALDRVHAGQSLDAVAKSYNVTVKDAGPFTRGDFVPGLGRLNAAIGTAFGLKPGETSGVVDADQAVYIMQCVRRHDADRAAWEKQKDAQRQRVLQQMAQQRWDQYLEALRKNASITDNRAQALQRNSQAAT